MNHHKPDCVKQRRLVANTTAPAITSPVLIVAGGAASLDAGVAKVANMLLRKCLYDFRGTVISGGTDVGIPGCVGALAAHLGGKRRFRLLGYAPKLRSADMSLDARYDTVVQAGRDRYSSEQVLRYWADILGAGIAPQSVQLVGIGGGPVSAMEYRIALALGASVGIVMGTGGSAEELLKDAIWTCLPNMHPLPCRAKSLCTFMKSARRPGQEKRIAERGKRNDTC
jgi:hypothetical protein